jgi:hypothetical protein
MRRQGILRTVFFIFFFSIGAGALSGSILCDELVEYCRNKHLLRIAEERLQRLELLNEDYSALLERLESEPNLVENIAPTVLGKEVSGPNVVYPRGSVEQLAALKEVLERDFGEGSEEPVIFGWLERCGRPVHRLVLFLSGGILVLISFVWFGPSVGARTRQ